MIWLLIRLLIRIIIPPTIWASVPYLGYKNFTSLFHVSEQDFAWGNFDYLGIVKNFIILKIRTIF